MLREIGEVAIASERAVSDEANGSVSPPRPSMHYIEIEAQRCTKRYRNPLVQMQES